MATPTNNQDEQIFINLGNEAIELTGADKEAFIKEREARIKKHELIEAEYEAKQEVRRNAITKLKALGLTETEAKIIIGIE